MSEIFDSFLVLAVSVATLGIIFYLVKSISPISFFMMGA